MATYLNPTTQEYPRHDGDLLLLFPDWIPGSPLPSPWVEVLPTEQPVPEGDNVSYEVFPVLDEGQWKRAWGVRPMTQLEKERKEEILQKQIEE